MRKYGVAFWLLLGLCLGAVPGVQAVQANDAAVLRTQLAAGYFQRGQYGVAIDEAKRALAVNPKYAEAYNVLGLIYAELKEEGKARDHFLKALSLSPDNPDINHNYGWFLCERAQYEEGILYYLNALKNPLYANPDKTLVNAGQCALKSGKPQAAQDYFERALRYRQDNLQARLWLVELGLKLGDPVLAKRYYAELQKRLPESAESLWLGVRVARMAADQETETRLAAQLRRQFPESVEALKLKEGKYE
ncbi:type IV pilus biogenesis/stability protein PilW [Chitiniphilus purpureus]|uniref:Type IV pilus biogenesis/stability protein PilW n=1 Tax=Chitiniphilus purpureus TaxID=2981137 RepID=A0ABY6DMD1_9NEIS|nr:type IV pilus biogenesis/stability protein PilW [Chitiniphilus sp. CD1]UXY14256.1 type IV pilus biogenesis/stability protein PilW [Chitiniphilus sp. CD1]